MKKPAPMGQEPTDPNIQARWNPIIMVGLSAHGDEEVKVEVGDDMVLLRVGSSQVRCRTVREALCAATGWVIGRVAVVSTPTDEE